MNRKLYPRLVLTLLVVGFIAFSALNNLMFGSVRLDLTQNKLYTVSDGTREILAKIDEPLDLYFFFSDKATKDVAPVRTYAKRVRELLEEYALRANGKIRLHVVDPEPFSEAEDQAAAFGLQAVPLNSGENIYFGLAASNAVGDHQIIGFFQQEREEFLEYEVSKLISGLVSKKPVIGLISGLQISGGFDMMTSRPTPAWAVVDQIRQSFDLRTIDTKKEAIDADITTLMIVHPVGLSDAMLYAIDQFVLKGGKALVFVDPFSESARGAPQDPMMGQQPPQTASNLDKLFAAWGLSMPADKIVGDAGTGLMISLSADQGPVQHVAFLGLGADNVAKEDVVTGSLESINLGMAGSLKPVDKATTHFEPMLRSSERAMLLDSMQVQMTRDPQGLLKNFVPTGERYTVAARISGPAKSAFTGPQKEGQQHLADSKDINVIVVADTDMLADRFWVQVQDFFGQSIATAWADNASFTLNALENMSGSSALIGIRSRGRFSRPFTLVQQIRSNADAHYRASAEALQQHLDDTEHRLSELQKSKEQKNLLVLSPEQEQTLLQFQDEKLKIRKQLREVRHQLDQDIEDLGTLLKLLNIVAAPLLLTLALFGIQRLRRRRSEAADRALSGESA